jgi:hypothetical protein
MLNFASFLLPCPLITFFSYLSSHSFLLFFTFSSGLLTSLHSSPHYQVFSSFLSYFSPSYPVLSSPYSILHIPIPLILFSILRFLYVRLLFHSATPFPVLLSFYLHYSPTFRALPFVYSIGRLFFILFSQPFTLFFASPILPIYPSIPSICLNSSIRTV